MGLSDEALNNLREVLHELGFSDELQAADRDEFEEFALFLLNLTAAAVKTREKMRLSGRPLPPSAFEQPEDPPQQGVLPGLD